MASAVCVRSEHTINIDRSNITLSSFFFFLLIYTNRRIIMVRKEGPENDNGDSRMPYPILCIFLYFRLRACAFGLKTKTKYEFKEFPESWCALFRTPIHFRTALSCGR